MQKPANSYPSYFPSDLLDFFCCPHAAFLNLTIQRRTLSTKPMDLLLQKKGLEHEKSYLKKLKEEGRRVVEIPKNRSSKELLHLTLKAARSGADAIYQANLSQPPWQGYADFLIKCEAPSAFGTFSYEVLDTKLAHNPEPKHILQLCIYSHLLTGFQKSEPHKMHLYLGNNSYQSFNFKDFIHYSSFLKSRFERFVQNLSEKSTPEPCNHCDICQWKERCSEEWKKKDHLSLVANIRRSEADKLRNSGIKTMTDLADIPKDFKIKNLNEESQFRLQSQAHLQKEKSQTGHNKYQLLNFSEGKGLSRLPKPNEGDLFFDIEGDPLYPKGLEYLFGIYCPLKKEILMKQLWANSHKEEKKSFNLFMDFIERHLNSYPEASIYHYNHYEPTALKRLACRYASKEEVLDALLRQRKFIDLYLIVKESLRTSEPGYSLKNMETFYRGKRETSLSKAIDSIVVYNRWRETGDNRLLKEVSHYNEIDCISTFQLRNWLLKLKPPNIPWFKDSSKENLKKSSERKEWEKEYEKYQSLLSKIKENKTFCERLSSLLEFHNREAKVQWWNFFERQNKGEEELIEDRECLGGLKLIREPEKEGKGLIYSYKFPPQEYRLKQGIRLTHTATMKDIGTIVGLNDLTGTVQIKGRQKGEKLPERFSIGPSKPIDSNLLRSAIYRFAQSVIDDEGHYRCVRDLLHRSLPRIEGHKKGAPLISSENLEPEEMLKIISRLNESYLFIQGPPGAGKTYISSHIILELLKRGKKVGVTSNSHKAIHNLLEHIERSAIKKGISFYGLKKSSNKAEDTVFNGRFIESKSKAEDIFLKADLIAGTAWLFSREMFSNHLDYLFIDEAGQIALANAVAMGLSAKNIVLVGDQMQLSQPIQGTHPNEAGLSVLEFLLNDQTVIPKERGLFLHKSYRLNKSLCRFISHTFYEDKLKVHKSTANRKLILHESSFPNEGIVFVSANHKGCTQKSLKEGQIIRDHYMKLLKGQFLQGQNAAPRLLNEKDILVVAPYNAQVNCLKSLLPEKARVGTIDKFQGQEAPVVLISMTTSSGEDIPRNIDFLFSRNRLNVALSRAKCLSIVVANPKLLEVTCKTVEEMKQINTFCHLEKSAFPLNSL